MGQSMSKKYELTDETKGKLRRIRALKDIERFGVKEGDLGGYIESEENLSHHGDAWVHDDARVYNKARVYGDAQVCDDSILSGKARVHGSARVSGNAWVGGDAKVYGNVRVSGSASISGNTWIHENASVYEDAWIDDRAQVYGNSRVCGNSRVHGDARVYGYSQISGDAQVERDSDYCAFNHVGSENGTLTVCKSQSGNLTAARGCFLGTLDEFETAVIKNSTAQIQEEYALLIEFARIRLGAKA